MLNINTSFKVPDEAILRNSDQVAQIRALLMRALYQQPLRGVEIELIQGAYLKRISENNIHFVHVFPGTFGMLMGYDGETVVKTTKLIAPPFNIKGNVMEWKVGSFTYKAPLQTILKVTLK
tara:strand:- start:95 stop:457 length:363 start_codon:yes stop_codon:yes gene_type:complete